MKGLNKIKAEIEAYTLSSNTTELKVVEALKQYYFNKVVTEELKLYKRKKKKVAQITKDLKISHRRFYKILDDKNIQYVKYDKSNQEDYAGDAPDKV